MSYNLVLWDMEKAMKIEIDEQGLRTDKAFLAMVDKKLAESEALIAKGEPLINSEEYFENFKSRMRIKYGL